MSTRVLVTSAIRLLLLLPILFGASQAIQLICAAALIVSLIVEFALYRRDKATWDDEDDNRVQPVPMPPTRPQRDRP